MRTAWIIVFLILILLIGFNIGISVQDGTWTAKVIEKGVMEWKINPKTGECKLEWKQ